MRDIELKEKLSHGDLSFPFALYHVNQQHPRYVMATHWHDEYEICRIISGELKITIDGETYIGRGREGQSDIFFINSGAMHSAEPRNCVYECAVFDLQFLLRECSMSNSFLYSILYNQRKFITYLPIYSLTLGGAVAKEALAKVDRNLLVKGKDVFGLSALQSQSASLLYGLNQGAGLGSDLQPTEPEEDTNTYHIPYAQDILGQMFETLRHKEHGYELKTFGLLYFLLGIFEANEMFAVPDEKNESMSRIMKMRLVLSYIHRNFKQPISIEELSVLIDLRPPSVVKLFKDFVDKKPMEYINSYRINCAMEMLKKQDTSITNVAYECGFTDVSYFTKVFKKYSNLTPREFIKQQIAQNAISEMNVI